MKNTVDDYILDFNFNPKIHERLEIVRDTAKKVFTEQSNEVIYHGVPTFMYNGNDIFNYAAYKDHLTFYIGYDLIDSIKKKYPHYEYSKAAVMIKYSEELPLEFIEEVCKQIAIKEQIIKTK